MLLLITLACDKGEVLDSGAPATVADCAATYSIANGYGFDNDEQWQLASKSPQMIEDYYCQRDDRACDGTAILTREAARCVGEISGIGDDPEYDMDLHYRGPDDTLVWVVEGLTWGERGSAEGWGGRSVEVDAWGEHTVISTDTWDQSDCQSGFG